MEYNIGFILGDPSADGHGQTAEYHFVSNHSAKEISEAYKKTTKLLSFNLVEEMGNESWVPAEYAAELVKLGIIEEDDLEIGNYSYAAGTYYLDADRFGDLYFMIAKYSLPDLEWDYRDLQEEEIYDLYGAAYRLVYRG